MSISLVASAARLSGVAPLAVFFDASATTSTATSRPFHDIYYAWNFGDTGSGSFSNGAVTTIKNTAIGPLAAHIFETPGPYVVTVWAWDGASWDMRTISITVDDPDLIFAGTDTVCVNNLGDADFSLAPGGSTHNNTDDFATAINYIVGTKKRLLFKRGGTWTTTAFPKITLTGPGIVGAYGAGAVPKITPTVNTGQAVLYFSDKTTPTLADWRFTDFEIDGSLLTAATNTTTGLASFGGASQITMLRLNIHDMHTAAGFSTPLLDNWNSTGFPGHVIFDQMAIAGCTLTHSVGGHGGLGVYVEATRLSFIDNFIDDMLLTEHCIRCAYADKAVYGNNTVSRAAVSKHLLKQHAGPFGGTGLTSGIYSQKIVVSENKFEGGDFDYSVTIGPEDAISDERVRDVIVERNWFPAGTGTQEELVFWASSFTARNNIFNVTGSLNKGVILITQRGIEPAPTGGYVYNNTAFGNSVANTFEAVNLGAPTSGMTVINNIGYAPNDSEHAMIVNSGSGLVASNNSSTAEVLSRDPNFAVFPPVNPADFKLQSASYAKGAGLSSVPVFEDFFRYWRTGAMDMGALAFDESGLPPWTSGQPPPSPNVPRGSIRTWSYR